ncbi:NLR family CARD domain-containing protein 4-like [Branchiostoma floridae]|uniref:NLR family CARD domain-containing protein 4-like n=1 Tax=Branchiostoma floridae TaxID=7739 RepID=A0A9J7LLT7_BRAFL|nr:NLR family CARD domain-containing protein 4-like [Branchiostoma floridae]
MGNLLSKRQQSHRDGPTGVKKPRRQRSRFGSLRFRRSKRFSGVKKEQTSETPGPDTESSLKEVHGTLKGYREDSGICCRNEDNVGMRNTEVKTVHDVQDSRHQESGDGKDEKDESSEGTGARRTDVRQPNTIGQQDEMVPKYPVSVHQPDDPCVSGSGEPGLDAMEIKDQEESNQKANIQQVQTTVTGDHNISVTTGDNSEVNIYQYQYPDSQDSGITTPKKPFPLEKCQDALKNHYRKRRGKIQLLPWNKDNTINVDDICTSVDLMVHNKCGTDFKRESVDSIEDMFSSREDCLNPQHILIWGAAGIGKTTILAKLVTAWTNGSSVALEKYDLVFEIALREVNKSPSLVNCIFDQLLPKDVDFTQDDLSEFMKDNDKVLLILDGYDECDVEQLGEIYSLLNYKILQKSTVVVTTRPTRISDAMDLMDPDTRVEIVGFSPDNIVSFVRNWFSNSPEQGQSLLQRISHTVLYTGILSVPFLLVLTCLLWQEDSNIPVSDQVCPLYDQLIDYLVKRYRTKDAGPQTTEETEETLSSLGELAFDGLLKNTLLFSEEDVHKYFKTGHDIPVHLGLLLMQKNSSKLNPANQFSFSHKTMQEYFAGRHLANKLQSQNVAARKDTLCRCFPDLKSALQLNNLLVFTCGRLGRDATFILSHLNDIYSKSNVKHLEDEFYTFFHRVRFPRKWNTDIKLDGFSDSEGREVELQCVGQWNDYPRELLIYQNSMELFLLCCYESDLTEDFAKVLFQRNTIQFSGANPRLYSVLSRVLTDGQEKVTQIRLVNTQHYVLGSVLGQLHELSNLTELNLRQSRLGQQKVNCTTSYRLKRKLQKRQISKQVDEVYVGKAPGLLAKHLPSLRLLKKFVISWNDLGPEDMKELLPAIKQLNDLEEIFLSGNDLTNLGKDVAELVASLPKLKVFKVFFCQLCLEELMEIASSLQQHCPYLKQVDYQLNLVQTGQPTCIGEEERETIRAKLKEGVKVCWERQEITG